MNRTRRFYSSSPAEAGEGVVSGCGCLLISCILFAAIGAFAWPYSINTWLELAGKEPVIVWWQGVLLGFCPGIGHLTVPVAVVTWMITLFM